MTDTIFKIKRTADGLFSLGGSCPHWNKTGKVWKTSGHVTSHLGQVSQPFATYRNCEIIELEVKQVSPGVSIEARLHEIKTKKDAKETERRQQREDYMLDERRKKWEELNKEFGS